MIFYYLNEIYLNIVYHQAENYTKFWPFSGSLLLMFTKSSALKDPDIQTVFHLVVCGSSCLRHHLVIRTGTRHLYR
jgi:hypothetical protein